MQSLISPYQGLRDMVLDSPGMSWLLALIEHSEHLLREGTHGDLPRWQAVLDGLPAAKHNFDGSRAAPVLGQVADNTDDLAARLIDLHPWRKGPLLVGGVHIDSEWRCDLKWARIVPHLDLRGHRVLDVGCGNGYYGWRMLGQGANCVIGIDPTLVYTMQWQACRHFSGAQANYVLPLGVEHLPAQAGAFDSVFSMGVLYHRRDPLAHLEQLASLLRPGGQVVLETLVIEGRGTHTLVPGQRYARMRNVWAIPTLERLSSWLQEAGLQSIRTLDVTPTSIEEQRRTNWMNFESLAQSLDPQDSTLTIEGFPAPVRAALLAKAPG